MRASILFKQLSARKQDDPAVASLSNLVEQVFESCVTVTKTVLRYMPEYTLHDEVHLERIVDLMARIIPSDTLNRLQPLELASLILAAAFHDIGMAPSQSEVDSLLKDNVDEKARLQYLAFRQSYLHLLERQRVLRAEEKHFEAQQIEAFVLSDFLRVTHAERGRSFLFDHYRDQLLYAGYNFAGRLADVCYSHNEDPSSLETLPCWELVRTPGEYCNWRFVAIMLRLADILDFDPKRTPQILFEHLGVRSHISVREWKKHQAITAWDIQPGRIAFAAQCPDPVIEKGIRHFISLIEGELTGARGVLLGMHDYAAPSLREKYALNLPADVDTRHIRPVQGRDGPVYEYVDLAFQLDHERIMSLVLGVSLYAERVLFLRELLQNAVDACRHRRAIHNRRPELGHYRPQVAVRLLVEGAREIIEVEDNGMGMDDDIVRNYFARVGRSYYSSGRFLEDRAKLGMGFKPISQFGIGILSVFMAGDKLEVETRRFAATATPISIEIAGEGALFWFRKGRREFPGTQVRLRLNMPSENLFPDESDDPSIKSKRKKRETSLYKAVTKVAPHVEFPIIVEEASKSQSVEGLAQLREENLAARSKKYLHEIDLDLTEKAPAGLNGIARVFLLRDAGKLVSKVKLENDDYDDEQEDLRNYLTQGFGYIQHTHVDRTIKEGITEGYSVEVGSQGRWTQQGFYVPYPIFPEYHSYGETWGSWNDPSVHFPFAIWYDLDLSGDFILPLSADRKSVLPTDSAWAVLDRISEIFANLLFNAIGKDNVRRSQNLFRQLVKEAPARSASKFLKVFDGFLGSGSRTRP